MEGVQGCRSEAASLRVVWAGRSSPVMTAKGWREMEEEVEVKVKGWLAKDEARLASGS